MAMSAESPTAIIAAQAMATLNVSFLPTHTVQAMPKKEIGGKMTMRCALVTETRLSKSGTVKLVASKTDKAMPDTKRIANETLRKAAEARRAARSPEHRRGASGDLQGENYEELSVWKSGVEGMEGPLVTHKPNQRAVLFKHQQRNQQARHGQENQDYAYANVKLSRFRVTAAAKHAAGKKSNEAAEGRSAKGAAPSFEPLPGPRNHEQATTSTM